MATPITGAAIGVEAVIGGTGVGCTVVLTVTVPTVARMVMADMATQVPMVDTVTLVPMAVVTEEVMVVAAMAEAGTTDVA